MIFFIYLNFEPNWISKEDTCLQSFTRGDSYILLLKMARKKDHYTLNVIFNFKILVGFLYHNDKRTGKILNFF